MSRTFVAVLGLAVLAAAPASAQRPRPAAPRFQPATPTVSPYLALLSNQGGALPNYFALVRPLQQQAQINQAQTNQLNRQAVQIDVARQEFGQMEARPTGTAGWFNNFPQQGPGFAQRSHYFGQWEQRQLPTNSR